jgi:hypothetical protein
MKRLKLWHLYRRLENAELIELSFTIVRAPTKEAALEQAHESADGHGVAGPPYQDCDEIALDGEAGVVANNIAVMKRRG